MSSVIGVFSDLMARLIGLVGIDVLASLAGLAIILLFLFVEGGPRSRPSH
jgi:hypothetical protein